MPPFVEQHLILLFGLLAVGSVFGPALFGLLSRKPGRQHARVVVDYVEKHGYRLLNPILAQKLDEPVLDLVRDPSLRDLARATSDIADIGRFDDGSDDWLAFHCELARRQVTIFNFTQAAPLRGNSGPTSFRVAKIQVDGLPRFSLEPRSAATAMEALVGNLLHQPDSTIDVAPASQASFGSRYWLRGSDPAAVADFFTRERIGVIEAERLPGTLASNAHYLVYCESKAMRSEADYDAFISVVERIVTRLL